MQDNSEPLDSSQCLKEEILDKLYSLNLEIPEDKEIVRKAILCRERKDYCVAYEILLSTSGKHENLNHKSMCHNIYIEYIYI